MTKPNNPNLSIPAGFAENGIKTDFTAEKIANGFDNIDPDILAGDNLNKLIDDTYKGLTYAQELGEFMLGKDSITNCILEAPNGVAEYTGSTVTAKQGLKVLIPNGKNTDGTFNNIEYTLTQDVTIDVSATVSTNTWINIYLGANGELTINEKKDALYLTENYTQIATAHYNGSEITELGAFQATSIYQKSDNALISSLGMPSSKFIDLTFATSPTDYTAPSNGYFVFDRLCKGSGQYMALNNKTGEYRMVVGGVNGVDTALMLPVKRGDIVGIGTNFTGTINRFRFYYAEGEVQ